MKLTEDIISYITNVVNTANIANIESLVLEDGRVRGMDEEQTVVLLHEKDVPTFPFDTMAFTDVSLVNNKLRIFSERSKDEREVAGVTSMQAAAKYFMDITVDDERNFVRNITMKVGRYNRIGARCSNPAHVKAPRVIHDTIVIKFPVTPSLVTALNDAISAVGNVDSVQIKQINDGVGFFVEDTNGEPFEYQFADTVPSENFSHKYPLKLLLTLLKQGVDGEFGLGEKGMLKVTINDLDLFVLPKVN